MNTFELKIIDSNEIPYSPTTKRPGVITQQIWVDGIYIDEPHAVDVSELVRSLFRPGEYFFFTCGCGEPGCAGIWDGFKVRHVPGKILWHFRRPVSQPDNDLAENDEFDQRTSVTSVVEYAFDREQFAAAMDSALKALKSRPENSEYSPYGFDRRQLDGLDAYRRHLNWQEAPGRRQLCFIADESNPLFLDGQFISLDQLGMSKLFESKFKRWQIQRGQAGPTDIRQRLDWLEHTRALLSSAYREGLSDDIDITLVAYPWATNGQLDAWDPESRLVSRQHLPTNAAFDDQYLCLSADKGNYCLWFDSTPEPKDQRYRFVSHGSTIYDDCPFLVPFALEKRLSDWASSMPDYKTPGPWSRWLLGRPVPPVQLKNFDWATFHKEGVRMANEIKVLVGSRATVFYELPWGSPDFGKTRRIRAGA